MGRTLGVLQRFAGKWQAVANTATVIRARPLFRSSATELRAEDARPISSFARCFPSWEEHAGVAIFAVGLLNGLLVVTGFVITWKSTLKRYALDCRVQSLKAELSRTERQLEVLFGPLRAITHATNVGFRSFAEEHRGTGSREQLEEKIGTKPRSREAQRYRHLISCTLQPLNRRAMELVLSHTHLIDGDFPECVYSLYSHVIEMDLLLERWHHHDYAVAFPRTAYPSELNHWASREFKRLREKQQRF